MLSIPLSMLVQHDCFCAPLLNSEVALGLRRSRSLALARDMFPGAHEMELMDLQRDPAQHVGCGTCGAMRHVQQAASTANHHSSQSMSLLAAAEWLPSLFDFPWLPFSVLVYALGQIVLEQPGAIAVVKDMMEVMLRGQVSILFLICGGGLLPLTKPL